MQQTTAAAAAKDFLHYLDLVEHGQTVQIRNHGRVVARLRGAAHRDQHLLDRGCTGPAGGANPPGSVPASPSWNQAKAILHFDHLPATSALCGMHNRQCYAADLRAVLPSPNPATSGIALASARRAV